MAGSCQEASEHLSECSSVLMAELLASARRTNLGQKLRVSYGLPEKLYDLFSLLAGQRPATTHAEGPERWGWRATGWLEAGTVRATGPVLIWKSSHYGVTGCCALSLVASLATLRTVGHQLLCPQGVPGKDTEWVAVPSSRVIFLDSRMEHISLDSPEESLKATREIIWCIIVKKKSVFLFNVLLLIRLIGFWFFSWVNIDHLIFT